MVVRILTGAAVEKSNFVMPNDEQLRQLMRMVLTKYPVLDSSKSRDWTDRDGVERERSFKNAFWALAFFTRIESVEKKRVHATSFWASEVDAFLHASDIWDFEISQGVFTLALIAHGDIAHTPLDRWPLEMSWGLQVGGGGHRATDIWKRVIKGEFRAPEVVQQTRESNSYPTPNVRIVGDGY
jgi:hypothetical protein